MSSPRRNPTWAKVNWIAGSLVFGNIIKSFLKLGESPSFFFGTRRHLCCFVLIFLKFHFLSPERARKKVNMLTEKHTQETFSFFLKSLGHWMCATVRCSQKWRLCYIHYFALCLSLDWSLLWVSFWPAFSPVSSAVNSPLPRTWGFLLNLKQHRRPYAKQNLYQWGNFLVGICQDNTPDSTPAKQNSACPWRSWLYPLPQVWPPQKFLTKNREKFLVLCSTKKTFFLLFYRPSIKDTYLQGSFLRWGMSFPQPPPPITWAAVGGKIFLDQKTFFLPFYRPSIKDTYL